MQLINYKKCVLFVARSVEGDSFSVTIVCPYYNVSIISDLLLLYNSNLPTLTVKKKRLLNLLFSNDKQE